MEGFSNLTDPVVPSTVVPHRTVHGEKCPWAGRHLWPWGQVYVLWELALPVLALRLSWQKSSSSSWLCFPAWKVTCGQVERVAQGGQKSLGVNPKSHGSASHHFLSCPGNKWCDSPQLHVPSSSLIPACGRAPLPLFPKTRGKKSGFYLLSKVSVWNSSSLPPSRMFLCNTL